MSNLPEEYVSVQVHRGPTSILGIPVPKGENHIVIVIVIK